jgi:DinB superfamily
MFRGGNNLRTCSRPSIAFSAPAPQSCSLLQIAQIEWPCFNRWPFLNLVIHFVNSDCIAIDRMKWMLTEDEPPLLYADETAYVRQLATHEQSLEDALILFEVGRRQFARVLRALPDEAFERRGIHNRRGVMTVGGTVHDCIKHVDDHLKFLAEKRLRLGKPVG